MSASELNPISAAGAPTPHEFAIRAVRECPHWNCGPWTDAAAVVQGTLGYWRANVATAAGYDPRVEQIALLLLDTERRLIGHVLIGRGGESYVVPDYSYGLIVARRSNAAFLIDAHNHPLGSSPQPSLDDRVGARTLARDAKACELELLDSMAIVDGEACSLALAGLLEGTEDGPQAEPEEYLDKRERWKLSYWLLGKDRLLQELVIDESAKAGLSVEEWVFKEVRGALRVRHFPQADPRRLLVSSAFSGQDEKRLMMALIDEAADRGKSTMDTAWAIGSEALRRVLLDRLRR